MENRCCAVVDLGTNTFHLIIAQIRPKDWFILHREKRDVRLGRDGLGHISDAAIKSAEKTLLEYVEIIKSYNVQEIHAFGTAALRSADNQQYFIDYIYQKTGICVNVISGAKEANYIHKGVLSEQITAEDNFVIMDIGGGSVEYIHSQHNKAMWFDSYNTGIAELNKQFPPEDPILSTTIIQIESFLRSHMKTMFAYWEKLNDHSPKTMIGASGSFEILFEMLPALNIKHESGIIHKEQFEEIYQYLIATSLHERTNMDFLPAARRILIIHALILIRFVLHEFNIEKIRYASFALKEGVLASISEIDDN